MARESSRATIDFFAAQDAARRRTFVLVLWFVLAWVATIAVVSVALALLSATGAFGAFGVSVVAGSPAGVGGMLGAVSPAVLGAAAAAVSVVTLGGAGVHAARLASGGPESVARLLGGVPVDRATTVRDEQRLVNVVEEMAIASGLPVPALYVLDGEEAINAFAAGFTPDRAVVAVTRGALERLTRDELQGVIAHEFSHLLNGDARLNLQLVAAVGGIDALAAIGRFLLGFGRRRLGRTRSGRGGSPAFLAGLCLWAAGSVGAFCARLARLAVSRQRELLADAAAVQFTRNPDGLASALAKIAAQGSAIDSPFAPDVAHLLFANGLASRWLATHPPIAERIRRITPQGVLRAARAAAAFGTAASAASASAGAMPFAPVGPAGSARPAVEGGGSMAAHVGRLEPGQVAHAAGLLAALPAMVSAAARAPRGARAVACALLADAEPAVREVQLAALGAGQAAVAPLAAALAGTSREDRMAVLELALPALDALSRGEAEALLRDLAALAGADGRSTVFEWAVQRIVRRRLAPVLGEARRAAPRAHGVEDVQVEVLEVLSVLAWLGARDEAGAQAALDAGTAALGVTGRWRPLPRDRVRATRLDAALARLDGATFAVKERLLRACAACALADGRVAAAEGEIVRAVAASLGCPMPPLVPDASDVTAGAA
jgi:Zn-dependent protease with chaperone function